jgi:hypothetical protein
MAATKNSDIILGEGITEEYYFLTLKDDIVNRPTTKAVKPYNMEELDRAIKEYATMGYTAIHCLIDMDTKVAQSKTKEKYLRLKQKYDKKQVGKTECKVYFYESYPSVELFFYYYFENSTAEKTNEGLKSWLKHKCGYETNSKYRFHKTFLKYGGCLKNAITNAKKSVKVRDADNFNCSYTEIGELIEYLGIK